MRLPRTIIGPIVPRPAGGQVQVDNLSLIKYQNVRSYAHQVHATAVD